MIDTEVMFSQATDVWGTPPKRTAGRSSARLPLHNFP